MAEFACVAAIIMCVAADIVHDVAKSGQKFPCPKPVYDFFGGFSMVKIHFFQKVLKNGLVSEKNTLLFPSFRGEGGV